MSNIAWGRFVFWSTAIIGTGYVCLKTTVPTPEQLYSVSSMRASWPYPPSSLS
ncbi:hypothetical protein CALVIDRAFT_538365 [Calocera viscosa TUFC12733]|uniref:Uncharacterized protein n=1 Tax=Calocera viscosa (strain TUFC12733) TaxID=1330018 RepID=A0A167L112_CALVF|nr:hypothetical protein CALVIDRAFT_538365 [Calocera viscosa TUFC12733]